MRLTWIFSLLLFSGLSFSSISCFEFEDGEKFEDINNTTARIINADNNLMQLDPFKMTTTVGLDPKAKPQYVFSIHSNTSQFQFYIEETRTRNWNLGRNTPSWRIGISVESMICYGEGTFLNFRGNVASDDPQPRIMKFCSIQNQSPDSSPFIFYDMVAISVEAEGDWSDRTAKLVASVYYDPYYNSGGGGCEEGDFYCGESHCIPFKLVCNGHPNCGLSRNRDEIRRICQDIDIDECLGPDCPFSLIALRISILVLFCFLLPPALVLLACRFQSCRSLCDKVHRRVSLAFNGTGRSSANDGTSSLHYEQEVAPQNHNRNCPHYRSLNQASSSSRLDEPPPSYDDFLKTQREVFVIQLKEQPPPPYVPPTLSEAINDHDDGGIVNPSFEDVQTNHQR